MANDRSLPPLNDEGAVPKASPPPNTGVVRTHTVVGQRTGGEVPAKEIPELVPHWYMTVSRKRPPPPLPSHTSELPKLDASGLPELDTDDL